MRGVSRNTVRNTLQADGPPRYQRRAAGSAVDAAEPRMRELLQAYPRMPATVIAERIGWQNSIRVLSGRVAELRPLYLPPDPAGRTVYLAGRSPSMISGSRRASCRWDSGRPAPPGSCLC